MEFFVKESFLNQKLQGSKNKSRIGKIRKLPAEDKQVQEKIKLLQQFITKNYYTCTNEILKSLGEMYVNDERFKNNIDSVGGEGTAEFVKKAILIYCSIDKN